MPSWKFWLIGTAIVLADIAGSVLLMHGGYELTAMLWAVLCALVMMVGVTQDATVAIVGIVIACAAGIVASGDDTPLFGRTARDVSVAEAAGAPANFLHFRDGRVLADKAEAVDIRGGTMRQPTRVLYTLYVAPVVADDWTPDQPVTVFAVTGHPGRDQGRSQWARPWRAGFRLGGLNAGEIREGIGRLARHDGIVAAGNAAIIRWTADPEAEAVAARRRLAMTAFVALLAWALAPLGVMLVSGRMTRARRH
ncbi:MAG: hypothetical protein JSR34_11150 [Proteobacteria bacterium]|nr:hypothetical protein [Pseudomonadota bacterium]